MALTREFKETLMLRARRDIKFRRALLKEAVEAFLSGDLETGKSVLRDYINATITFERLARSLGKCRAPLKIWTGIISQEGSWKQP